MLTATEARKASVHGIFRNSSTKRSEVVKPTSKNPPTISQNQGMNFLSLDERESRDNLRGMADRRGIGNIIGAPRFLAFLVILIVAFPIGVSFFHRWALGAMAAFDVAAVVFLVLCMPLLKTQ